MSELVVEDISIHHCRESIKGIQELNLFLSVVMISPPAVSTERRESKSVEKGRKIKERKAALTCCDRSLNVLGKTRNKGCIDEKAITKKYLLVYLLIL